MTAFTVDELSVEHFRQIDVQRPPDIIIRQIQDLIASGKLAPGLYPGGHQAA